MWWFLIILTTLSGGLVYLLTKWQARRSRSKDQKNRYNQLVTHLDEITFLANQLAPIAQDVKAKNLLDYYESSLKMIETLLETMRFVKSDDSDHSNLNAAFFLANDCKKRLMQLKKAFRNDLKGKPVASDVFLAKPQVPEEVGCYFCSRPTQSDPSAKVKVRIEGVVKEVDSCPICKKELKASKKVNVLHFVKDGKTLHWSEVDDYIPSEDYWNINQKSQESSEKKLKLVVSRQGSRNPPQKS